MEKTKQNKKGKKVLIRLEQNKYKLHQGKAWIAKIDPDTKKILKFVEPENVEYDVGTTHKYFWLNIDDTSLYRFSARYIDEKMTVKEFHEKYKDNDKSNTCEIVKEVDTNEEYNQENEEIEELRKKLKAKEREIEKLKEKIEFKNKVIKREQKTAEEWADRYWELKNGKKEE